MGHDLRVVKTKRAIREALLELMSAKPLSGITISEVCSKAEINRKTFYSHYRSVSEVIEELENEVLTEFSGILAKSGGSILEIGAAIRDISSIIEQRREFFRQFTRQNPDLFNKGKIKAMLCRMLAVALKNTGALSDNDVVNTAAEFSASGLLGLYAAWFDGGCAGDLALVTDVAVSMVTRGFSAFVSDEKLAAMRLK